MGDINTCEGQVPAHKLTHLPQALKPGALQSSFTQGEIPVASYARILYRLRQQMLYESSN